MPFPYGDRSIGQLRAYSRFYEVVGTRYGALSLRGSIAGVYFVVATKALPQSLGGSIARFTSQR